MMKALPSFAFLAAGLLMAAPLAAQQHSIPQENLDCAIWAAYQAGEADDYETENGFALAMVWFIGLYEGQTGQKIDRPLAERTIQLNEADIDALTSGCVRRFMDFGGRLENLSSLLGSAAY
jgi:hypothetical protein